MSDKGNFAASELCALVVAGCSLRHYRRKPMPKLRKDNLVGASSRIPPLATSGPAIVGEEVAWLKIQPVDFKPRVMCIS
jgi:hypothetical protein